LELFHANNKINFEGGWCIILPCFGGDSTSTLPHGCSLCQGSVHYVALNWAKGSPTPPDAPSSTLTNTPPLLHSMTLSLSFTDRHHSALVNVHYVVFLPWPASSLMLMAALTLALCRPPYRSVLSRSQAVVLIFTVSYNL